MNWGGCWVLRGPEKLGETLIAPGSDLFRKPRFPPLPKGGLEGLGGL